MIRALSRTIKIVQLTDCHLPENPRQLYRGIDAYKNLQTMLPIVGEYQPDLILATGDLSEEAGPVSYRAIQGFLKGPGPPVLALPGNHDDANAVAEIFPGSPVDTVSVSECGEWKIIRLNSCLRSSPAGRLNESVLSELEQVLSDEPARSTLVALHHPPINIGSPWIDKYRLQSPARFLGLIDRFACIKVVLWGHVHQVHATDRHGIAMLSGPSSAINSLPGQKKFTSDLTGPACRWIELGAQGKVQTGIFYAERAGPGGP